MKQLKKEYNNNPYIINNKEKYIISLLYKDIISLLTQRYNNSLKLYLKQDIKLLKCISFNANLSKN